MWYKIQRCWNVSSRRDTLRPGIIHPKKCPEHTLTAIQNMKEHQQSVAPIGKGGSILRCINLVRLYLIIARHLDPNGSTKTTNIQHHRNVLSEKRISASRLTRSHMEVLRGGLLWSSDIKRGLGSAGNDPDTCWVIKFVLQCIERACFV